MGCGVYWQQIREIERAMGSLRRLGIDELSPGFMQLSSLRGKLMRQVGIKFPRSVIQLVKLIGLSPGVIVLWEDIESGFMSEARVKPGAPPVYKSISDETAVAILRGEITKELELELMTPATDIDN